MVSRLLQNLLFLNQLSHINQRKRLSSLRLLHSFQVNPSRQRPILSSNSKNSSQRPNLSSNSKNSSLRLNLSSNIKNLSQSNHTKASLQSLRTMVLVIITEITSILNLKVSEETTTRIDRSTSIKINRIRVTTSTRATTTSRVTTTQEEMEITMVKNITTTRITHILTTTIQITQTKARLSEIKTISRISIDL